MTRRARRHLLVAGFVLAYLVASAALLAGMGLGLWLAGGVAGDGDAWRALWLAHVHLNVFGWVGFGWVGLAVVGTQFTLWPTVLRTRMMEGVERAVRWSLPPLVLGLAAAAAGLASQHRAVARAGLAGYAAGLAVALVPFVRTAPRRPPHTAASIMLGAGRPGSPSQSPPTWPPRPAAPKWWRWMARLAGWSRWWPSGSGSRP